VTGQATELDGRSVLVMGLGSFGGGLGATRFLLQSGARVTVTDLRRPDDLKEGLAGLAGLDVELVLGEHRLEDFQRAELVVPNPAVAPNNEFLMAAREAGATIRSEVELFLERCPARLVAVTGTQGKSSTCSLLAQLLRQTGFRVHLGGNIGGSLLSELETMRPDDVCVFELSSYQLDAFSIAAPGQSSRLAGAAELVAITNILSDHIERHGSREAYAQAKLRILELLDERGSAIVSEPSLAQYRGTVPASGITRFGDSGQLRIEAGQFRLGEASLGEVSELPLPGEFQLENALIALGAAAKLGAPAEGLRRAIPALEGLSHRLQSLGQVRGRRVWDNGVSTTPDSTASALVSLESPCILVCGGRYKATLPLDVMIEAARERVHCAVTFGADAGVLAEAFRAAGIDSRETTTLSDAVEAAFEEARAGDEVLFSPACASFDAYRNFQERAREFRRLLEATR